MKGIAGSKESNDCLITVEPAKKTKIEVNSIVGPFFYQQIYNLVEKTLKEMNVSDVYVLIEDKGALDYTIKSRLITALERMKNHV
jgi:citrate lyase subunit gamma (acyl carrier protein)